MTVRVKAGDRSQVVRLDGSPAAPIVRVTGPGGQVLTSDASTVFKASGALRVMRLRGATAGSPGSRAACLGPFCRGADGFISERSAG